MPPGGVQIRPRAERRGEEGGGVPLRASAQLLLTSLPKHVIQERDQGPSHSGFMRASCRVWDTENRKSRPRQVSVEPAEVLGRLSRLRSPSLLWGITPCLPPCWGGVGGHAPCFRSPLSMLPCVAGTDPTVAPLSAVAWADQPGLEPGPGRTQATTATTKRCFVALTGGLVISCETVPGRSWHVVSRQLRAGQGILSTPSWLPDPNHPGCVASSSSWIPMGSNSLGTLYQPKAGGGRAPEQKSVPSAHCRAGR